MTDWAKVLNEKCCGGYYSENPCKAKTCNAEDEYCPAHKKLVKK